MEQIHNDLVQDIEALSEYFSQLRRKLLETADNLHEPGIPPPEELLESLATARNDFMAIYTRIIALARSLAIPVVPTAEQAVSLKDFNALLRAIIEAEDKKTADEQIRHRALAVLKHVLTIVHTDGIDFAPLGITFLIAPLFLIFKWVAAAASAWLEIVLYCHSPTPALTISLVVASGSMTVWTVGIVLLMPGLIVYSMWHRLNLPEIPSPVDFFTYLIDVPGSVFYATSVGLWAFPLAAWLWRRKVDSEAKSTWAFLEGESEPLALPAQAPIRPRLAMIVGLAVGLMFCVLLVLLRYNNYIAPGLGRLIHSVDGLTVVLVLKSLSALMQASAAAIAAAWIRRLGALHGLCSASVAGYVITVGWMLFFADYGGINFFIILGTGTFLALPVALGVSALADWIRRTRSRPQAEASSS